MKFAILFVLAVFLLAGCSEKQVACTMEAKICPDGSGVGRSGPDCEFDPCPESPACDAETQCSEGDCYKFADEEGPICYVGDPCIRCPGYKCAIAESYPMQVICQ